MPVTLQCPERFPLSAQAAQALWQETIRQCNFADDQVNVRCVDIEEISRLNEKYRGKDAPTNILTFSYDGEHDIALCWPAAEQEAAQRGVAVRDYAALLLVHAFLHAAGTDHERSGEEALLSARLEQNILGRAGFRMISL